MESLRRGSISCISVPLWISLWGPHSRKCLLCLWKGVTKTIELPAASWWLCPQTMSWVERGPQGSSPTQWDLFPFCTLTHSLTGILLQFLLFQSPSVLAFTHSLFSGLCLFPLVWKVYKYLILYCSNWAIDPLVRVRLVSNKNTEFNKEHGGNFQQNHVKMSVKG